VCRARRDDEEYSTYSEELQRSHARPEPRDLSRSALAKLVITGSMRRYVDINRLEA
jgi:hypothetical protein